jgi:flagellar biogenesis protein FliO
MKQETNGEAATMKAPIGGLAGWMLKRLRGVRRSPSRLAVLERITLAPRQSLALVEAEGQRFLVATSAEGTPAFYALDEPARRTGRDQTAGLVRMPGHVPGHRVQRPAARSATDRDARVSW